MLYPIAIIKQDNKYYGRLPDIPTLEISGDNMADIISSARLEVINYLQLLVEEDKDLPEGSDVSTHLTSGEYAGWTWAIVNIGASRIIGEDVAVTLNIPERLMQKLLRSMENQNSIDNKNNETSESNIESYIICLLKKALQEA